MKTVISILAIWIAMAASTLAGDGSMKDYMPALRAFIANGELSYSNDATIRQQQVFLLGITQGAFVTLTYWNINHPGEFRVPLKKDPGDFELLNIALNYSKTAPQLLYMDPANFISGALVLHYKQ